MAARAVLGHMPRRGYRGGAAVSQGHPNLRLFHSQPRARNSEAWPVRVVADALSATTAEGCYLDSRRTERRGCYIISRQSRPSASTSMWLWITFGSKGDLRRPSVRQSAITEDF